MNRKFNKNAYDQCDMPSKLILKKIIENNSDYRLINNINEELYKKGDLIFKKENKLVIFENEVRQNFQKIVGEYFTIHIPIRKKNTPANFYIIWNPEFTQFILINLKKAKKYFNNIINVKCNNEMNNSVSYSEYFIDIPKNITEWYILQKNDKILKLAY